MPKPTHRTTRTQRATHKPWKSFLPEGTVPRPSRPSKEGTSVRQGSQAAHRSMRERAAASLGFSVKAYLAKARQWNAGGE